MAPGVLVLAAALLCGTLASSQDALPRIQPFGDTVPFLARASGNGARSHRCADGAEFIVTLASPAAEDQLTTLMNSRTAKGPVNSCRTLRHVDPDVNQVDLAPQLNAVSVCLPLGQELDAHLQTLLAMEGVVAVEENVQVNPINVSWHLDRIDQVFLPLDGLYNPEGTGEGKTVYITDTGADASHPEFEGRVTSGYSVYKNEVATHDEGRHGTHTAGLVGSKTYGVAKNVTIVPVKVFSDNGGGASTADIIAGINWVISTKTASIPNSAVMSMSLGQSGSSVAGDQALQKAAEAGIIPVVAAGNDNADACGYWPAGSQWVITVGATDKNDYRSKFSNYGSCVDLYAPGTAITSTLPGGIAGLMSGTSMATPIVSGTVALYLEKQPNATLEDMRKALIRNAWFFASVFPVVHQLH